MNTDPLFGAYAKDYIRHGIAVYPLGGEDGKRPLVKGPKNFGLPGSRKLTLNPKFKGANIGFQCGERNKITVVDIDTPDTSVCDRASAEFGDTPVKIRTGSGKYQFWYGWNGEGRSIRPFTGEEIDILGGGNCVAPPSRRPDLNDNAYAFIEGGLTDLHRLPAIRPRSIQNKDGSIVIQSSPMASSSGAIESDKVPEGMRNDTFFPQVMRALAEGVSIGEISNYSHAWNKERNHPPLSESRVNVTVASAIGYQLSGNNWVGGEARVTFSKTDMEQFGNDSDAMMLDGLLRLNHGARKTEFAVAPKAMAEKEVIPGWSDKHYRDARNRLIRLGRLVPTHEGGKGPGDPSLFRLPNKGELTSPNIINTPLSLSPPASGYKKGDSE